ncbi:MAG: BamA/TamA family outer membrane protein [Saprospiraceae bacterium]|nr:BamA/TamA family outer membrane protein [Saprospiraceae bacterium]
MKFNLFFLLFFIILYTLPSQAQTPTVYIEKIDLKGNKKTKDIVILNQIDFQVGDSVSINDIIPIFERNEVNLQRLWLFEHISFNMTNWEEDRITIEITVNEMWYIYPFLNFDLADRTFNTWWTTYNRDIRRVNLGGRIIWRNILGYNEYMKLSVQFGFTRKFEFSYYIPALDKKQRFGFGLNLLYSDNKEIAYNTINNQQLFYRDLNSNNRQYIRWRYSLQLRHRISAKDRQQINIQYRYLQIGNEIVKRNPYFFLKRRWAQSAFILEYIYERDLRNIRSYPTSGYFFQTHIRKEGLGIFKDLNQLFFTLNAASYYSFGKKKRWIASLFAKGRYAFVKNLQPYHNQIALGYENSSANIFDYVRGYQFHQVNGQDFVLLQTDLAFKIISFKLPILRNAKNYLLRSLPIHIYARVHADYGYVWDRFYATQNPLSNEHMMGTGLGLDFAFYSYNLVIQLEYSFNKIGENALYLRYKIDF